MAVPTGFSGLYWPDYAEYFKKMPGWLRLYDQLIFHSDRYRDITFARKHELTNCTVIPNGAADEEFLREDPTDIRKMLDLPKDAFLILHVGTHTGSKGHEDAIRIFFEADIENAVLLIVGNGLPPTNAHYSPVREWCLRSLGKGPFWERERCPNLCSHVERDFSTEQKNVRRGKRVLVREFSRTETVAAYKQADLFLFPSFIECSPIVLFEAAAAGTPFLTSAAGNADEIVEWTKGGAVLPSTVDGAGFCRVSIKESACVLETWFHDKELLKEKGESGFSSWRNGFTWEKITDRYLQAYLGGAPRSP